MKKSFETGLAVVGFGAAGALAGYLFGTKRGFSAGKKAGLTIGKQEGAKNREEQILQEFVSYIPLGSIGRIANELIEENGLSENFPMLVVMPDKYDYLEGIDPEE